MLDEFVKHDNADTCIKISACIELIDLLEPNDKGYQIKYDKELEVTQSTKKLKTNSISY